MPRHRKTRVPRHRAQRPEESSGRHAQLAAGVSAASGTESPDSGDEPARSPSPSRLRPMRSALFTPWFAAAAGFVVAAGVALESPHAVLSMAPPGNAVPCKGTGCTSRSPAPGSLALPGTGKVPTPSPSPSPHSTTHAATGGTQARRPEVQVKLQAVLQQGDDFLAKVTLSGRHELGSQWRLSFEIKGADNLYAVQGANWYPTSADRGTAFAQPYGQPLPDSASFILSGNGALRKPTECRFRDAGYSRSCTVSYVRDQQGSPGAQSHDAQPSGQQQPGHEAPGRDH